MSTELLKQNPTLVLKNPTLPFIIKYSGNTNAGKDHLKDQMLPYFTEPNAAPTALGCRQTNGFAL